MQTHNRKMVCMRTYLAFETAFPSARSAGYLPRPAPRIALPCSTIFLMSVSGRQVNKKTDKVWHMFGTCLNPSKATFS